MDNDDDGDDGGDDGRGLCKEGGVKQGEKMMLNDKEEEKNKRVSVRTMIIPMWTLNNDDGGDDGRRLCKEGGRYEG